MSAPVQAALLCAVLLVHSTAQGGGRSEHGSRPDRCAPTSQVVQLRCSEVDSGAVGPLCAEAIGHWYDAFEGAVCLVVVPVVEERAGPQVEHEGAQPAPRPQVDPPARGVAAPALPGPEVVVARRERPRDDALLDRDPAPPLTPG